MKLKTEKTPAPQNVQKVRPAVPRRESIILKVCKIVIEDIRYKLGRKDTRENIEKSREAEMKYKEFRERFG